MSIALIFVVFADLCWSSTMPSRGWPVTQRLRTGALVCPCTLLCSTKCTTSLWTCSNERGVLHNCCHDFSQQTLQRHRITALPSQAFTLRTRLDKPTAIRQRTYGNAMLPGLCQVSNSTTGGKETRPSQWTDKGLKVQFGSGFIQLKCLHISYLLYVFKCVIS